MIIDGFKTIILEIGSLKKWNFIDSSNLTVHITCWCENSPQHKNNPHSKIKHSHKTKSLLQPVWNKWTEHRHVFNHSIEKLKLLQCLHIVSQVMSSCVMDYICFADSQFLVWFLVALFFGACQICLCCVWGRKMAGNGRK